MIGTKVGMTQIFDEKGNVIPVTVISAGPCIVTGIIDDGKNGRIQLGYGDVKEKNQSKPYAGQFKKKGIPVRKNLKEFQLLEKGEYKIGQELKVDVFQVGDYVDVEGISKGKGFAGVVKRYGFRGGPSTHGQSDRQRAPGTSGAGGNQKVLKGTRKPGHMGNVKVKIQNSKIIAVDPEKNLMLIRGAVPGVNKGLLIIRTSVKGKKDTHRQVQQGKAKKKVAAPAPAAKK
jgi:large subunit ribosomal protein L3